MTGSLKFDSLEPAGGNAQRPRDRVLRYFRFAPARPVLVAGSTMKGEEAVVLRVFRRLKTIQPSAVLIVAPRHPERFAEVVQLCQQEGFRTVRRSDLPIDAEPRGDVVVLDTIGELATVYQLGTVVFVGGSLVATGGHNILEPAVYGRPVVFGPHMQNFAEIATAFVANGAGVQVDGEGAFEEQVLSLMSDPVRRARLGCGRPGPGRSQPRCQGEDPGGARRPAAAAASRLSRQRPAVPRALAWRPRRNHPVLDLLYGRIRARPTRLVRAPARRPAAAWRGR